MSSERKSILEKIPRNLLYEHRVYIPEEYKGDKLLRQIVRNRNRYSYKQYSQTDEYSRPGEEFFNEYKVKLSHDDTDYIVSLNQLREFISNDTLLFEYDIPTKYYGKFTFEEYDELKNLLNEKEHEEEYKDNFNTLVQLNKALIIISENGFDLDVSTKNRQEELTIIDNIKEYIRIREHFVGSLFYILVEDYLPDIFSEKIEILKLRLLENSKKLFSEENKVKQRVELSFRNKKVRKSATRKVRKTATRKVRKSATRKKSVSRKVRKSPTRKKSVSRKVRKSATRKKSVSRKVRKSATRKKSVSRKVRKSATRKSTRKCRK